MTKYKFTVKDGTKILLRQPRLTDAKIAKEYINSFVGEKKSGFLINERVSFKNENSWLKKIISDIKKKQLVFLFAETNGKIVGSCEIRQMSAKHSHRATFGIGVIKNMRRKGLGNELCRRTISLAKKKLHKLEIIELSHFS